MQQCPNQGDPHLVVEIIPQQGEFPFEDNSATRAGFVTPATPTAGAHVTVTGPYVLDSNILHDLLATPVIAAAGVLKLPELATPAGHAILGQVIVGSLVGGIAAYRSLRFLTRYFHTRTLTPFAIYCIIAGTASLTWLLAA